MFARSDRRWNVARSDRMRVVWGMSGGVDSRSPRFFCATRERGQRRHHEIYSGRPAEGLSWILLRSGEPKDIEKRRRVCRLGSPPVVDLRTNTAPWSSTMRATISRRRHPNPLRPVETSDQVRNAAEQAHLVFRHRLRFFLATGITAGWFNFRKRRYCHPQPCTRQGPSLFPLHGSPRSSPPR